MSLHAVRSALLDLFGEDFIYLTLDPLLAMGCVGQRCFVIPVSNKVHGAHCCTCTVLV